MCFQQRRVSDPANLDSSRLKEGVSPNGAHKEWSTLSAIFRYAAELGLVAANPVLAVRKPRIKLVQPNRTPTEDELLQILHHMHPSCRRFFLACCNTGCRRGELRNCNVSDADLDRKVLVVTGKGSKTRALPMNEQFFEVVKVELESRPNAKPNDPLFVSRLGRRYGSMRKALNSACDRAGVERVSHHSLRHGYASLLGERGVDLFHISQLLGHSSVVVTHTVYVKQPDAPLRQAAESFSIGPQERAKNWQSAQKRSSLKKREVA